MELVNKLLDALQQVVEELVRLPLRLVPSRHHRSLPTVKRRSHIFSYFNSCFFGGRSGGLVFFVSSLGLYHSRLRDLHTVALFLEPLLGEPQVLRPSLHGLLGRGSVSLTLKSSLLQPRHVHTQKVRRMSPPCVSSVAAGRVFSRLQHAPASSRVSASDVPPKGPGSVKPPIPRRLDTVSRKVLTAK